MRKKLKLAWKVVVASGMLAIVVFVTLCALNADNFWKRKGVIPYFYKTAYSGNYVIEYKGDKIRTKAHKNGKYLSPKIDQIFDEVSVKDTLTVFWQDGKRGYLDIYSGKIAIPAQFDRAWIFSEGIGAVVKDNKVGFIDKNENLVIPYQFKYVPKSKNDIDYIFKNGYCTAIGENLKQGIINTQGKWVVDPIYDTIKKPIRGYRVVEEDGEYGVLDSLLNLIIPISCRNIDICSDGIIVMKNGEQYKLAYDAVTIVDSFVVNYIDYPTYCTGKRDKKGELIYEQTNYCYYNMYDKYGLMDPKTGKAITKAIYDNIVGVTAELFSCIVAEGSYNNYSVILNGKGEVIE